jgi:STE24 endopeptidase
MAKALIRTVDFRASSPGVVEETLFYDHPSIARRIRRAMKWKRNHLAGQRDGA